MRLGTLINLSLLIGSTVLSFLACEWVLRWSYVSDTIGWNLVAPVAQRVEQAGQKRDGVMRILTLGDSFAEWRDTTNDNFFRVAERQLVSSGQRIDLVNLGEAGTGLPQYFGNLLRYGPSVDPDLVIIALYLGNDLTPSKQGPLADPRTREALIQPRETEASWQSELVTFVKRSILINYIYRLLKQEVPVLQSGFLERTIAHMQRETGRDDKYVSQRLAEVDPALVEAARGDAINVWDLAIGVFFPDYYAGVAKGNNLHAFTNDLGAVLTYTGERYNRVALVLIPPPVWVAERYREYFKSLGYGHLGPLVGEPQSITIVRNLAHRLNIPVLDLLPVLRQAHDEIFIPRDVHLNLRGHEIAGEALASFLSEEGLIRP